MDVYTAQSSSIYDLLPIPTAVKRRVPRALKRSISWASKSSLYRLSTGSSDSVIETPPPSYRSRNTSSSNISDATSLSMSSRETCTSRPSSASSDTLFSRVDEASGVNWKYAEQGCALLNNSRLESFPVEAPSAESLGFLSRQQYVHAATYILRGLPVDLNAEEKMGIETALPRDIRERVDQKARELQLLRPQGQGPSVEVGKQAERSFLHRLIAHTMLQFFLFLNFLLPYVKLFLGSLYQYERRHRVSERVFSAGVNGVDVMGKRGLDMSNAICGLNDGKVGDSINGLFVWWIRGVTGGIHEGVGEGLNIMNRRKVEQSEAEAGDRDRVREL